MIQWIPITALAFACSLAPTSAEQTFRGASDISAAVFLDDNHVAVAGDEVNALLLYDIRDPSQPALRIPLDAYLRPDPDSPEADIEAAAPAEGRIYWITSHGRNKDGKVRSSRRRLFAARQVDPERIIGGEPLLVPIGTPCQTLIEQFLAQPSPVREPVAQAYRQDEKLSKKQREKLAPKEEGLNIEGMTWYPPHQSLLIGLRNPLLGDTKQALVIELLNPAEVIESQAPARFGQTLTWNLDRRGIRAMEYHPPTNQFFILAGSVDSETTFALYAWDGNFSNPPKSVYQWPEDTSLNPESIAVSLEGRLWIASDDGTLEVTVDSPAQCQEGELLKNGKCPNKYLLDSTLKTFRVRQINPSEFPR